MVFMRGQNNIRFFLSSYQNGIFFFKSCRNCLFFVLFFGGSQNSSFFLLFGTRAPARCTRCSCKLVHMLHQQDYKHSTRLVQ